MEKENEEYFILEKFEGIIDVKDIVSIIYEYFIFTNIQKKFYYFFQEYLHDKQYASYDLFLNYDDDDLFDVYDFFNSFPAIRLNSLNVEFWISICDNCKTFLFMGIIINNKLHQYKSSELCIKCEHNCICDKSFIIKSDSIYNFIDICELCKEKRCKKHLFDDKHPHVCNICYNLFFCLQKTK